MRVLLALTTLLLLPGVAQAKPVCGPSTKTHTLASSAEARVYRSSTKTFACSRGHAAVRVASNAKLAGHFAADVSGGRLRVYDLVGRTHRAVSSASAKARGFTVNADGVTAWIEDTDYGVRLLRTSAGGVLDSGDGIKAGVIHLAGTFVSWQHGAYVRFGSYGPRDVGAAHVGSLGASLGTYDGVTFELGGNALTARYRDGRSVNLERFPYQRSSTDPSYADGIDGARVDGATLAVREVRAGQATFASITSYDLRGGGTPEYGCTAYPDGRRIVDFVVSRSGRIACVVTGGTTIVEVDDETIDSGDASVGGLKLDGNTLSWHHGTRTLTAPLTPGQFGAVKEPCGPASAGTLTRTATGRVYAQHGVAIACSAGTKRTYSLGAARPILDMTLNGHFASITRVAGGAAELRVRDVRTARSVGRRAIVQPDAREVPDLFGTVTLSPDGLAVYCGTSMGDTAGTAYSALKRTGFGCDDVRITGNVVSWIASTGGGYHEDYEDYFELQNVKPVDGLHLPRRDTTLQGYGSFSFALQRGELLAHPNTATAPFTSLGPPTAEEITQSGPATVHIHTAAGDKDVALPTASG